MKKVLLIALLAFAATFSALAYDFKTESDGLCYDYNPDGTSVTLTFETSQYPHYTSLEGSISIPSYVSYNNTRYKVSAIGSFAFSGCSNITSIDIPSTVTSIGSGSFFNCSGLSSITIPNSVISIGSSAFSDCSGLNSAVIGNSVTTIEDKAFYSCSGIMRLLIPNSVVQIGDETFAGCTGLTSVRLPESLISIGAKAFENCNGLTNLFIPKSVASIGTAAFYGCKGLTEIDVDSDNNAYDSRQYCNAIIETASNTLITGCINSQIPYTVTAIGESAFHGLSNLTSIAFPESLISIGKDAFYGTGLTSVDFPESLITIGELAFGYCRDILSVEIPNSVTTIGENAFLYCSGIKDVVIGNAVVSIGTGAFSDCIALGNVTFGNSLATIGDRAFRACRAIATLTIPNSVVSIGGSAFYNCSGLVSVAIGNSVAAIGESAFGYCNALRTINVDADNTFYDSRQDCNAIIETASNTLIAGCRNTTIPLTVTAIGPSAFYFCSGLTSIDIHSYIKSIGNRAFAQCKNLKRINAYPDPNKVTLGESVFEYIPTGTCELHVMHKYYYDYAYADQWKDFENIIDDLPEVLKGDLNGDGSVDGNDVSILLEMVLSGQ